MRSPFNQAARERAIEEDRLMRERIRGAVVVEAPDYEGPEAGICLLRLVDGTFVRLCSTELGWWLEDAQTVV